jgi:hypothetical protein
MRIYLFLPLLFITSFLTAQDQYLFINEVMPTNQTGLLDPWDLSNEDWLELYYAPGESPLKNLAGYFLSDDPDSLDKWMIVESETPPSTIVAGQHLFFWIDKDPEQGANHADFKLSGDGETVYLVEPDGETIVDSVEYPVQAPDISYGRECDGCENWVYFNNSTPDDDNEEVEPGPEILFVNEVLAENITNIVDSEDEHEGWIEIFNPNSFQVNLAGHYLSNNSDIELFQFPYDNPILTVVPPDGFLLVWCDNEASQGENHASFFLESTGTITLTHPDMTTLDTYNYESTDADVSWGREDDGSPNSMEFSIPTPRVTNGLVIVQPEELYINEILADNELDTLDGHLENEDWFEIYNPNSYPVNIAGYYFTDNEENPQKWKVPNYYADSTTVPAGGWLLFWADEDSEQGINHASFRLKNNGESLQMFGPDGFTMADEVNWGPQTNDISKGRLYDGDSEWVYFYETTPEASNNDATISVLEHKNNNSPLLVYPNPLTGSSLNFSEKVSYKLCDSAGKIILSGMGSQVDVETLVSGMYFVISEDGRTVKFIKP